MAAASMLLNAPRLGDAVAEAEKTGNEGIIAIVKTMADAAKEAGFTDDSPMLQVMSFLGSKEHEEGKKVQ